MRTFAIRTLGAVVFAAASVSAQQTPPSKAATPPAKSAAPAQQPARQTPPPASNTATKVAPPAADAPAQQATTAQLMTLQREVFTYNGAGRRDPMVSLMATGDIRPLISELKVTSIKYDESGSNHSAVLLNTTDKKTQYRVHVGQTLGRMKVTAITRKEVVFAIQEFGMDRTERLPIRPDTARKQ